MMKSGDILISGYWPRESNPGFRDNCGTNTSYATEDVSRPFILRGVTSISTAVITESWVRFPGPISRDTNLSRFCNSYFFVSVEKLMEIGATHYSNFSIFILGLLSVKKILEKFSV